MKKSAFRCGLKEARGTRQLPKRKAAVAGLQRRKLNFQAALDRHDPPANPPFFANPPFNSVVFHNSALFTVESSQIQHGCA